jgi:hypothetical protein
MASTKVVAARAHVLTLGLLQHVVFLPGLVARESTSTVARRPA